MPNKANKSRPLILCRSDTMLLAVKNAHEKVFTDETEMFTCLDTMREEKTSGIEVPTAKKDKPMTESGTLMVYPMMVINHVTS